MNKKMILASLFLFFSYNQLFCSFPADVYGGSASYRTFAENYTATHNNVMNITEGVLRYLDKRSIIIFELGTLIGVDDDFAVFPIAGEDVQMAFEAAGMAVGLTTLDPNVVTPAHLIKILAAQAIVFLPITDNNLLLRLNALGATHLDGVVYVGNRSTKAEVLRAFFQEGYMVYLFAYATDTLFQTCDANSGLCTSLRFIPYEL